MRIFYGLVNKDAGSAYGVEFPDVPGCFSAADDSDQLLPNACDALLCHLEGEELPEASDVDAIREKCGAELEAGAFLLAVPYIETTEKQTRANISLDTGELRAIDAAASDRNMSRSAFIVHSTKREIEGRHKEMKTKIIVSDSRKYTFEASEPNSKQCRIKLTCATLDESRSEFARRDAKTYESCLNGLRKDYIKESAVWDEVLTWATELPVQSLDY